MTRKEKIQYLKKYRQANGYITSLLEERENLITLATHITTTYNLAPGGSGNHSKIEECAVRIAEIDNQIEKEMQSLMDSRENIECVIEKSPKESYKILLKYRYMSGMRYEKIADVTGTSVRNVRQRLLNAIDSLDI